MLDRPSRRSRAVAIGGASLAALLALIGVISDVGGAQSYVADIYRDHLSTRSWLGWVVASAELALIIMLVTSMRLRAHDAADLRTRLQTFENGDGERAADSRRFDRLLEWFPREGISIAWLRAGLPLNTGVSPQPNHGA